MNRSSHDQPPGIIFPASLRTGDADIGGGHRDHTVAGLHQQPPLVVDIDRGALEIALRPADPDVGVDGHALPQIGVAQIGARAARPARSRR